MKIILFVDKEKEVHNETERLRRQINSERKVQDDLKNEILILKSQLDESKQGLLAAARLSDQLENSKNNIAALKEEGMFALFFIMRGMIKLLTNRSLHPSYLFVRVKFLFLYYINLTKSPFSFFKKMVVHEISAGNSG